MISLPVGLNQSLIYRLSGDRHPHGTDPGRARADGFERPIYYGLGTYGIACRALMFPLMSSSAADICRLLLVDLDTGRLPPYSLASC